MKVILCSKTRFERFPKCTRPDCTIQPPIHRHSSRGNILLLIGKRVRPKRAEATWWPELWHKCKDSHYLLGGNPWLTWAQGVRCPYHAVKHTALEQQRRSTHLDDVESPKQSHLRTVCE